MRGHGNIKRGGPIFEVPAAAADHAVRLTGGGWREVSAGAAKHKLVYVCRGRLALRGAKGEWTIVTGHMVFIPAGRPYEIEVDQGAQLIVAHLDPARVAWPHEGCWATGVSSLATEMLRYALRWTPETAATDRVALPFFTTMGLLIPDWFTNARILWLPYGRSAPVNAAMRHAMDHLADAGIEPSAAAAGLSPRTLRRRFLDEVGMTWRQFVREARLTRALDLLARQELKVGDVAHAVGFRSLASFNQAVRQWTGRSPGSYLRDRHPPGDLPRENELPG